MESRNNVGKKQIQRAFHIMNYGSVWEKRNAYCKDGLVITEGCVLKQMHHRKAFPPFFEY